MIKLIKYLLIFAGIWYLFLSPTALVKTKATFIWQAFTNKLDQVWQKIGAGIVVYEETAHEVEAFGQEDVGGIFVEDPYSSREVIEVPVVREEIKPTVAEPKSVVTTPVFSASQFIDEVQGIDKSLLLELVNQARSAGCNCGGKYFPPAPAVSWNSKLETSAMAHSVDMKQNSFFDHTSPKGRTMSFRVKGSGYTYSTCGENIAMGHEDEREVVKGWLNSPGHCRNIMNKSFREMGVARSGEYWTQVFGTEL